MAAKLSKQELEGPDIFQSTIERVNDYIAENKIRFYVILAVTALVIAAATGGYFYWNNYQTSSVQLYAKARIILLKTRASPRR